MKVYIKKEKNSEFSTGNLFLANDGFHQMGFEIIYFEDINLVTDNKKEDIIVGYIGDIRISLRKFGIEIPYLNYPEELSKYLGRKVWKSTLYNIANNPENWGVFIKPIYDAKRFTGVVVNSSRDLIACAGSLGDTEVWCSEVVNFVTEWRCFVRYGEILDVKRYKGDWRDSFDASVIEQAVKDFTSAPKGYGVDFGITDKGETLLIEVNEGYSLGAYGLESLFYAKLLAARWAELTGTEDPCYF